MVNNDHDDSGWQQLPLENVPGSLRLQIGWERRQFEIWHRRAGEASELLEGSGIF